MSSIGTDPDETADWLENQGEFDAADLMRALAKENARLEGILDVLRARVDDAGTLMATSYVRSALEGDPTKPEPRK